MDGISLFLNKEKIFLTDFSLIIIFFLVIGIFFLYLWDKLQKKHTVLRNYPVIGHFRYIIEYLGIYLRQYLYSSDREELPFNRTERSWVYRAAKKVDTMVGFGSTRDFKAIGTVFFVDAPFPTLGQDAVKTKELTIGPDCDHPYVTDSLFNISAMSFGSISKKCSFSFIAWGKNGELLVKHRRRRYFTLPFARWRRFNSANWNSQVWFL